MVVNIPLSRYENKAAVKNSKGTKYGNSLQQRNFNRLRNICRTNILIYYITYNNPYYLHNIFILYGPYIKSFILRMFRVSGAARQSSQEGDQTRTTNS